MKSLTYSILGKRIKDMINNTELTWSELVEKHPNLKEIYKKLLSLNGSQESKKQYFGNYVVPVIKDYTENDNEFDLVYRKLHWAMMLKTDWEWDIWVKQEIRDMWEKFYNDNADMLNDTDASKLQKAVNTVSAARVVTNEDLDEWRKRLE